MKSSTVPIFILTWLIACTAAFTTHAADLTVHVSNIQNDKGTINIALWRKSDGFLGENPAVAKKSIKATPPAQTIVFSGLGPDEYAVSLYHDENENRDLDANLVGLPVEGYAFSKNARGTFGPPSFGDAAFQLENKNLQIEITLVY